MKRNLQMEKLEDETLDLEHEYIKKFYNALEQTAFNAIQQQICCFIQRRVMRFAPFGRKQFYMQRTFITMLKVVRLDIQCTGNVV